MSQRVKRGRADQCRRPCLSALRQCELVSISRLLLYREPVSESEEMASRHSGPEPGTTSDQSFFFDARNNFVEMTSKNIGVSSSEAEADSIK